MGAGVRRRVQARGRRMPLKPLVFQGHSRTAGPQPNPASRPTDAESLPSRKSGVAVEDKTSPNESTWNGSIQGRGHGSWPTEHIEFALYSAKSKESGATQFRLSAREIEQRNGEVLTSWEGEVEIQPEEWNRIWNSLADIRIPPLGRCHLMLDGGYDEITIFADGATSTFSWGPSSADGWEPLDSIYYDLLSRARALRPDSLDV